MKRTHDKFYLNENNNSIKQVFVEVADLIDMKKFKSIADVGCATGAFPNYLKQRFSMAEITGIEYVEELLDKAKNDFPNISFLQGNVLEKKSIEKKFDVITLLGVLSIFDDYRHALNNLLSWLQPKGRLILHNMVSEYDIDVFVKYKPSSEVFEKSDLESGWNIISKKSLEIVAKSNNSKVIFCEPFILNVELSKKKDLMRSWTEDNISGGKDIFNALHIRQPQKIVIIEK